MINLDLDLEKKIDEFFTRNKENIIEDIFRLVRIPSISIAGGPPQSPFGKECAEVLDLALKMAEEKGFKTHNFEYYVGTAKWGESTQEIGLCTHLDVVPEGNDWIYTPYDPAIIEGHLVGRGVSDDKGPAVLMMYVIKCIEELNIPMKHAIKLIMGCNEECGMKDLEYYVKQETPPKFTLVPDSIYPVNNGEKGRGHIVLKSKILCGNIVEAFCGIRGNLLSDRAYVKLLGVNECLQIPEYITVEIEGDITTITAKGLACHATKPETGVSAIKLLFEYLLQQNLLLGEQKTAAEGICHILSDYNGEGLGIAYTDTQSGSVTHVMSTMEFNGQFTLDCTVICPVTMDMDNLRRGLNAKTEQLLFTVDSCDISSPIYISPEEPLVKTLMDVYDHVHNRHFPPIVTGGTYAKMLPNALAFGNAFRESPSPFEKGHGGIHKPDECISILDLLESGKIYVLSVLALDGII